MRRIFEVDSLLCRQCQFEMQVVSVTSAGEFADATCRRRATTIVDSQFREGAGEITLPSQAPDGMKDRSVFGTPVRSHRSVEDPDPSDPRVDQPGDGPRQDTWRIPPPDSE